MSWGLTKDFDRRRAQGGDVNEIAALPLAFAAGLLTILSPCILPLAPIIVSAARADDFALRSPSRPDLRGRSRSSAARWRPWGSRSAPSPGSGSGPPS